MRKSAWLLSAGFFALSVPVHAQDVPVPQSDIPGVPETDTDDQGAEATQGATAEGAAVDDSTVQQELESAGSGEIIVTATRRNEALSDVPLAVSAVTAETLEYTGASDIRQLQQVSPSLLVSSTQSEGATVARIRGIGTVGDNPGLESSVALFIDGVYRSRTGVGFSELGPIDRIEVLRGPQGTLFGRNASAGLISVITAKPLFTPMFAAEGSIGNYDYRRLEGSATGPISGDFAARLDAVYVTRDGFLEDVISGRDINDRNRYLVRAQGLYEPSDKLSVRIVGDLSKRDETCCAAVFLPTRDVVATGDGGVEYVPSSIAAIERALGAVINDDPFDRLVSVTPGRNYHTDVDDWGVSGEVVYDFAGAELTSITAYRFNDIARGQDLDYNNLDIWFREDGGGSAQRFKTFTQELRLQGETFGGRLDWLVGGYLANEKLRVLDNVTYGADYGRYGNCLVAANFASSPLVPDSILAPGATPNCFNPAVATGTRNALLGLFSQAVMGGDLATANALAGQITALGAFAQLDNSMFTPAPINFALPVFGTSGFANLATALGVPGQSLAGSGTDDNFSQKSNNWALFTHNIFEIASGLDLTVGLRYTHERKELNASMDDDNVLCGFFSGGPLASLQQFPCVVPSAPGDTFFIEDSRTENEFSGTVVLSYKFDDILTYASYSRGYKAGGFNLDRSALYRANAIPNPDASGNGAICVTPTQAGCAGRVASGADLQFEPEINNAVELGMKYNGRGIDVNLALFHQLFSDFQLNTFNGLNFVVVNVNSCEDDLDGADGDNNPATGACTGDTRAGVRSMGVEFELFARPMRDVNLNFGAIYADTRYRDDLVGTDGVPLTNALFQLPGRRISNSAEWTVTSSVAWTPPIGDSGLRGLVYADFRHMSEFNTGSDLDIEKTQEAFTVVNARLGLSGPDRLWGVEVWAQNLFDEDYTQVAFDAPIQGSGTERGVVNGFYPRSTGLFGAFLGEPRTYGLTLRGRF